MKAQKIAVNRIHANPWNPNVQSSRVEQATRESIATFGFVDPVTVRPHPDMPGHFQIIDGEHRWRAAQDLQIATVIAVVLDVGDAEAKKLTVILNETRGKADQVDLAVLLEDLREEMGDDLGLGLPYSPRELDDLLALANEDWRAKLEEKLDADKAPAEPDEWVTITCRVPQLVATFMDQARDRYRDEAGAELPDNAAVADGMVLERCLAAYLQEPADA